MENQEKPMIEKIEQILSAKKLDELDEQELSFLKTHLGDMDQIKAYHQLLGYARQTLDIDKNPRLVPDPLIHSRLKERLVQKHKPSLIIQGYTLMKNLLNYRIPAYQVSFGAIIVAMIWVFNTKQEHEDLTSGLNEEAYQVKTTQTQLSIGRTVKEDSALISKFVVVTM